jgi:alkaline phosphatase D
MLRVVQISDTHLGEDPVGHAGWAAALAYINRTAPALVIHTGDIVREDPHSQADHRYAKSCLGELPCAWAAVPGNHDIGDGLPKCPGIDTGLLQAFRHNFGPDHWAREAGGWLLVGVNDLLFDTGSELEAAQWDWLETTLSRRSARNAALFLHKPPFLLSPHEHRASSMTVSHDGALRLWRLVRTHDVRLVACGHRHEYRAFNNEGVCIVWCPTTSALLDERTPPLPHAAPSAGLIEYRLLEDGLLHSVVPLDALAGDRRAAP